MPKFIVVHMMPTEALKAMLAMTPEEMRAAAADTLKLRTFCSFDAYWVRSWVVPEQGKIYCEWNAKDAESIRKVFKKVPAEWGIEAIYEMQIWDAEDFRYKISLADILQKSLL